MQNPFSSMSQTNKIVVALVLAAFVIFGGFATFFLLSQNQDLRQQARVDGGTGGVVGVDDEKACGSFSHGYQNCNPAGGSRSYKLCDNGTMRTFSCSEGQQCKNGHCETASGTTETTASPTSDTGSGGSDEGGTGGGADDSVLLKLCDSAAFKSNTGTIARTGERKCGKDLKTLYTCNAGGAFTSTVCAGSCASSRCISATPVSCKLTATSAPIAHDGTTCSADKKSILKCVDGVFVNSLSCSAAAGLVCDTLADENLARCVNKNRVADGQCSPTNDPKSGCVTGKGYTPVVGSPLSNSCSTKIICGASVSDAFAGCSLTANLGDTKCGGSLQSICSATTTCANAPVPCDSSSYIVDGGKCIAVQKSVDGACNLTTANYSIYGCQSNSAYKDATCVITGLRCGPKPASVTGNVSTLDNNRVSSGTACANGVCTSTTATSCIAIHQCDSLDPVTNHCTIIDPEVRRGPQTVTAQQEANRLCKCVQVDVLTGANGTCDDGHIKNADYSTLIGNTQVCYDSTANCGQQSAVVTDTTTTTTTETTTTTQTTTTTCGQSCNSTTLCPNNHSCSSGVCKLNACLQAGASCNSNQCAVLTPSPSPTTTLVCGNTCTTTSQCPQDHTCNGGKCQLTECVNGQPCAADKCRVNACGESCTGDTDCPNNHKCDANKCILNSCATNPGSCSTDRCRVTKCAEACGSNADCPNNHTCNSGVCKLNDCLVSGASCTANQCATTSTVAVVGCNITCVGNADCQAIDHICVDTADGRRCRLETNIASDTCGGAVVVDGPPTSLPIAGSADILKAIGIGAAALVLGAFGFFML